MTKLTWSHFTPARTHSISGLKSWVSKSTFSSLKMMVKSGLEFILKLTEPLQSCCCPVQKNLPSRAELAWQVSRYLWRGSVNFKINSRPLFTIIFKLKNDNFKTRDFSPLIKWVLAGVSRLNKNLLWLHADYKSTMDNHLLHFSPKYCSHTHLVAILVNTI